MTEVTEGTGGDPQETTVSSSDARSVREVLEGSRAYERSRIESEDVAAKIIQEHGHIDVYHKKESETGELLAAASPESISAIEPASGSVQETSETTGLEESSFADSDSAMSDEPPLTREELHSHLRANEKAVEGMAQSVKSQIGRISDKQDDLSDDIDANRRTIWAVGGILAVIIVGLFGYALQRTDTIGDRVFENAQRIEQVAPESQAQSGADQGESQ